MENQKTKQPNPLFKNGIKSTQKHIQNGCQIHDKIDETSSTNGAEKVMQTNVPNGGKWEGDFLECWQRRGLGGP